MENARPRRRQLGPVLRCVSALASLKFTVLLFVLSVGLVFFGTLAQDKQGIWDVVSEYFRSFVVWVPFNIFLPRQWFGDTWESVQGGFWFLGGKTIGSALFINLLAAHSVRFRVQTRGWRLVAGCVVIAIGTALAFMMIANGNFKDGIQDQPYFSWGQLWSSMVAGVGVLWLVTLGALFKIPARQFLERILLQLGFLLLTVGLGWMGYLTWTGSRLDDASLRILWQLIQGTIAGGVLLAGCVLAFKKRAGVVLLHAGIGLMMINELLVAQFAKEEQMTIAEGETVAVARDIRTVEIAVVNRDDPEADEVVAIPQDWLRPGEMISHEYLPFDIYVERFDRNAALQEKESPDNTAAVLNHSGDPIEVTEGLGTFYDIVPQRPIAGADASDQVNIAAAYVSLWEKADGSQARRGEPLATLLLSQQAYLAEVEEKVNVAGATYFLGLRHRETVKPYKIALEDVSRETYVGTETPKGFASEFEITDKRTGNRLPARISMNNPLRYGGETFYQSGYHMDRSGAEMSTLQIVTNDGWMIPYVSCMLVIVGMLAHFGVTLVRFLRRKDADAPMLFGSTVAFLAAGFTGVSVWKEAVERRRRKLEFERKTEQKLASFERGGGKAKKAGAAREQAVADSQLVDAEGRRLAGVENYSLRTWLVVLAVVGFASLYTLSTAVRGPGQADGFAYKEIGKLPVVNDGRVLPLDALARNTLRMIKRRETFEDLSGDKQPAVKWMMDVMVQAENARDYEIFRIVDHELQALLKLPKRKSKNYSYNEVTRNRERFEERFTEARETATEERTNFQKALLDLKRKLNTYEALERIHKLPAESTGDEVDTDTMLQRIDLAMFLVENIEDVPLVATTTEPINDDGELGWETYHVAATRQWLASQAAELNVDSTDALAAALFQKLVPDEQAFIDQRVEVQLFQSLQSFIRDRQPDLTPEEVEQETLRYLAGFDEEMRQQVQGRFEQEARRELLEVRGRFFDSITTLVNDELLESEVGNPAVQHWTQLLRAYQAGDATTANAAVKEQLAYAESINAQDHKQWVVSFESFYRQFSPLYISTVLYVLAGVVSVIAWIGWTRDLNRAAFWLLVFTLAVHTFALVSRMVISGRPPVTNLYSSAVFIGWGSVILCLILEMVFRIGIGNVLASVFGFICLMVAYALSIEEDTFKVVVAVLDTQFWLATHVVCITLGYATTFVAGGLGVVYIIGGLVSRSFDSETRKMVSRMLYGMVCFSIFFSFFGTVLGGLWADDSWGRFWGWDPKENGALLIVIWNALLLHARWGGMVRERGMAMLAVGGNIITTWSWFLVNQLGIGLHSYGFTEGVLLTSGAFCATQLAVIGLGAIPKKFWSSYREHPSVS